MHLRLKYPPTPEAAPEHAALCVSAALVLHDLALDYSVESLFQLDDLLEHLRQQGLKVEQLAEVLFAFGCYVGEVFVRHAGGRWRLAEGSPLESADAGFALIIELGSQRYCNPVGKVFKRFELGAEHGLPLFYTRFAPRLEAALAAPELDSLH